MPVNQERMQLGIDGLRSGRFKKGIGALHRVAGDVPGPNDTYCCLGGLSIIARENGCPVTSTIVGEGIFGNRERFDSQTNEYLSFTVMEWYGFDKVNPDLVDEDGRLTSATNWNDQGPPGFGTVEDDFGAIADAFARTYITTG
jgi:hypothetical protein